MVKNQSPPPPGKLKNFSFLPETYFSPGIFKSELDTPGQTYIAKSWFLPQNFVENPVNWSSSVHQSISLTKVFLSVNFRVKS